MKQVSFLLTLFFALGGAAHATEESGSKFRAGAAAVDITPKAFDFRMPGTFTTRTAQKAHDPLYARAVALDDGTTALALVVVDNIGVAQEVSHEAKAVVAVEDQAERDKLSRLAEAYARRTLSLAEASETVTVPLQAVGIGDLAVCAIPFETFAEIGLELKRRSPFPRTMVISLANGSNGYLPTPEQHELGGYETWLGTNRVQKDASVILVDNLLEMLAELQKAPVGNAASLE